MPLPEWAEPVVAGDAGLESTPVIFRGKPDGRRVVVIAFDLRHSICRSTFLPILWNNLVNWLTTENRSSSGIPDPACAGGEPHHSTCPEGVTRAVVTRPDGSAVTLQSDAGDPAISGVAFGGTEQLGLYTVRWGENGYAAFAVNLFSPQESDLVPLETLSGIESSTGSAGVQQQARREWWRLLVLAGLGVLVAEMADLQPGWAGAATRRHTPPDPAKRRSTPHYRGNPLKS